MPDEGCENTTDAHEQLGNMRSKLKNPRKLLSLQCHTLVEIRARIELKREWVF